MIVELKTFQVYSNVFGDENQQTSFIQSAQNIVSDYLGYSPEEKLLNYITGELEDVTQVPEMIKLTIMRIASLLQSEGDGNIGVNSKSFGDGGTRVFINYTNFDKFLIPISNWKVIRI